MTPTDTILLRDVTDADMASVQAIYAHHVKTGAGSFEYDPPELEEMIRRRDTIVGAGFPYLVAVDAAGKILGYAYAGPYRPRRAYRFTVEDSVYIAPDATGQGVGARLLTDLIQRCTNQGFRQMIAVIGDSANHGSIKLHRKMGFRLVGTFENIGFKFGRWLDSVIMQRPLGPGGDSLPEG